MSMDQAVAVARDLVALTERCGRGADEFDELLAFDTSGHLLVHVKGFSVRALSLSVRPSRSVGSTDRAAWRTSSTTCGPAPSRLSAGSSGTVVPRNTAGRGSLRALVRRHGRPRGGVHRLAASARLGGMDIVSPAINDYLLAHSEPADEVLRDLAEETHRELGGPRRHADHATTRASC